MQQFESKLISVNSEQDLINELTDHFVFSWRDSDGTKHIILLEPLTWSVIAIKICEGALAAIGAKLFNEIFGMGNLDFAQFQKNLLEAIRLTVRAAILESDVEKVHAQLNSIDSLFKIYTNSPSQSLLETLLVKTSDVVHEADRLGLPAVASFGIDGSLMLLILQERFTNSGLQGDKKNIALIAASLIDKIPTFTDRLIKMNLSRFSSLGGYYVDRVGPVFYYFLDGGQVFPGGGGSRDYAESLRLNHIEQERKRLDQEILGPLYALGEKWAEIQKRFKS